MWRKDSFPEYLDKFKHYFLKNRFIPSMELVAGIIGVSSKKTVYKFYQDLIKAEYLIKEGTNYLPSIKLQSIPYYESVQAGFPSPATDDLKQDMKVEDYLVTNPLSTIYVKVSGDSMVDAGIHAGDILVVDKGLKGKCGDIVVAIVDGDYTVKYLDKNNEWFFLKPWNKAYSDIFPEFTLEVFGVVTGTFRKY